MTKIRSTREQGWIFRGQSLQLLAILLIIFQDTNRVPHRIEARQVARQRLSVRVAFHNDQNETSMVNSMMNKSRDKSSLGSRKQMTIEIAVFIDQALSNRFTSLAELNSLILTMMNQVRHILRYSSLKQSINIKLNLVEHLKDSERYEGLELPNPEKGDIDLYLSNFCKYQNGRLQRDNKIWWDHAILLSGLDLYKVTNSGNQSGVLGLSWVGGMCKGKYSCTVGEAIHLESAFVIAHEIGHNLGMMHDGAKNRCDPNRYIMSDRTGAGKTNWSSCSNEYLENAIKQNQLNCLLEDQSPITDQLFDLSKLKLPGQVYSINDQCKLAHGNNYTAYVTRGPPHDDVCRELWCASGSWAVPVHPALEGSYCDRNSDFKKICREGRCVDPE